MIEDRNIDDAARFKKLPRDPDIFSPDLRADAGAKNVTMLLRKGQRIGLDARGDYRILVFDQFTTGGEDYGFTKTVVPVQLARYGDDNLVSRSQARRLLARVERFKTVVLDFQGIDSIGQEVAVGVDDAEPAVVVVDVAVAIDEGHER